MTKDEALKLALEALESCTPGDYSTGHVISPSYGEQAVEHAITAIKQALAAPVQEPVIDHSCKDNYELIMKWADIYAAQTGNIYSEAARDPSKSARMADERTMLACVVAQAISQLSAPTQKREHITDGSPCWCNTETVYVDPETDAAVIVHKEPQ